VGYQFKPQTSHRIGITGVSPRFGDESVSARPGLKLGTVKRTWGDNVGEPCWFLLVLSTGKTASGAVHSSRFRFCKELFGAEDARAFG
jgi:hypothetical protein